MRTPASAEVTGLSLAWSEGDKLALEELLQWKNRAHFFGISAQVMLHRELEKADAA